MTRLYEDPTKHKEIQVIFLPRASTPDESRCVDRLAPWAEFRHNRRTIPPPNCHEAAET